MKKILCIDVEATCWESKNTFQRDEIIEIGVTPIDIATKTIGPSVGILVKPVKMEVSEFCTKLTTITPELLDREGVSFSRAIDTLKSKFGIKDSVFASWGAYDVSSIERNCRWNSIDSVIPRHVINVKSLFAACHGYTGGLDSCARDIGLEFEGTHHRGKDDSRMVARVLLSLMK